MKKQFLISILLAGVAGCSTDGKLIRLDKVNECPGGRTGVSYTPVVYGDSYLVAFNITEIAQGSEWLFRLVPKRVDGLDLSDATVLVEAKPGGPGWLKAEGEFSDAEHLRICVPDTVPVGEVYEYKVSIEQNGEVISFLDPRARVIER
jgi:hypothetical protein